MFLFIQTYSGLFYNIACMKLNSLLTEVEKKFNFAGSLPVVGAFSGALRTMAAQAQAIAGAILALFGLIGKLVHNTSDWSELADVGLQHFVHGVLNFVRGLGEMILAASVVGALGMWLAQYCSKNKFNPIVKYNFSIL